MNKLYKIGEVTKILGLSQHTLKHYEDKGLIKPVLDETNGYRYFTYQDVGIIITIRNLREMGFSVTEAGDLLRAQAEQTAESFEARLQANEETIADLQRKNAILAIRSQALQRCLKQLGTWEIANAEDALRFVPHFYDDLIIPSAENAAREAEWEDVRENSELAFTFNLAHADGQDETPLTWGLVPYDAITTNNPLAEIAQVFPAGKRLDVFLEGDRGSVERWLPRQVAHALRESGETAAGQALCLLNSYTVHADGIRMLATVTIPLA